MAVRLIAALICGTTLLACGSSQPPLLGEQTIARDVGTHYGDPHAVIVKAVSTTTEVDDEPMYVMTVTGHLRKDGVEASTIMFSALATRLYVWDVRGLDGSGQQVWSDDQWGSTDRPGAGPGGPGSARHRAGGP